MKAPSNSFVSCLCPSSLLLFVRLECRLERVGLFMQLTCCLFDHGFVLCATEACAVQDATVVSHDTLVLPTASIGQLDLRVPLVLSPALIEHLDATLSTRQTGAPDPPVPPGPVVPAPAPRVVSLTNDQLATDDTGCASSCCSPPPATVTCRGCASTQLVRRCAGCWSVGYCSLECQRRNWPRHKLLCPRLDWPRHKVECAPEASKPVDALSALPSVPPTATSPSTGVAPPPPPLPVVLTLPPSSTAVPRVAPPVTVHKPKQVHLPAPGPPRHQPRDHKLPRKKNPPVHTLPWNTAPPQSLPPAPVGGTCPEQLFAAMLWAPCAAVPLFAVLTASVFPPILLTQSAILTAQGEAKAASTCLELAAKAVPPPPTARYLNAMDCLLHGHERPQCRSWSMHGYWRVVS